MEVSVKADLREQIQELQNVINKLNELNEAKNNLVFLNIKECCKILNWSQKTTQELFNRPDFPSCDFGKEKVVSVQAFIKYFDVPRRK